MKTLLLLILSAVGAELSLQADSCIVSDPSGRIDSRDLPVAGKSGSGTSVAASLVPRVTSSLGSQLTDVHIRRSGVTIILR